MSEPVGSPAAHGAERLGELVGRGRTAEVYRWGPQGVVKLFHPFVGPEAVAGEARVAAALTRVGAPVPRYDGRTAIGDRHGLLFERVEGRSMLAALVGRPWLLLPLAARLADLHLAIHRRTADADLSPWRARLRAAIEGAPDMPDGARERALTALSALPDGDRVCHSDFHPDNVLLAPGGPVVIDWMTAARGSPAADVARTLLLLEQASLPPGVGAATALAVRALRRLFARAYWRRYCAGSDLRAAEVAAWRAPLAAARLSDPVPPDERRRLLKWLDESASD